MERTAVYEESIRRGSELLDERGPQNWRKLIDLETLDVQTVDRCVLGQLYGSYVKGIHALGFAYEDSCQHGFATNAGSYRSLTRHWKDALANSA